jgi:hypothetical protein
LSHGHLVVHSRRHAHDDLGVDRAFRLEAQQQLYPAQNTLAKIRPNRLRAYAQLCRALGGRALTDASRLAKPARRLSELGIATVSSIARTRSQLSLAEITHSRRRSALDGGGSVLTEAVVWALPCFAADANHRSRS